MNEARIRRRSWEWLERKIAQEICAAERLRRSSRRRKPFIELLAEHNEARRRRPKAGRN